MAANVDFLSYVNNPELSKTGLPWWGTGKSAKERQYTSWLSDDEAREVIGFPVEVQPLYRKSADGLYVPVDDGFETYRPDLDKHIATVGNQYRPFCGDELVELGSYLVNDYGAKWDTVGSLRNNRIIFATLRLDVVSQEGRGLKEIDGSDYFTWFMLSSSHDGSTGISGDWVSVRAVCENTFNWGRQSAKGGWTVRHTGDAQQRAVIAHQQLGLITRAQDEMLQFADKLAQSQFEIEQFEKLTEDLFPVAEEAGDRAKSNRLEDRQSVKNHWLNTSTVSDDLRFTRWGALNGITEWSEHVKGVRDDKRTPRNEKRLLATLFGGKVQQVRAKASDLLVAGLK